MSLWDWRKGSPFEPLAEHMARVRECVNFVLPMFESVRDGDHERLTSLAEQVFKAEYEADKVKNDIRGSIPKAFALPVYRGDLLAFVHVQDELADTAEDLAVQLTIKKLELPASITDQVFDYVRQVLSVCDRLYAAVELLESFTEVDFSGARSEQLLKLIGEAEHEEWVADKAQYELAKSLFALEDEMKATDIFLWSGVFQNLGALANHADKTAERVRRMLG